MTTKKRKPTDIPDDWSGYGEFSSLAESYSGTTFWFEEGYSATFKFWLDEDLEKRPHPYRYELVLHDLSNERILGFDNAHPVSRTSGRFKRRSPNSDHFHRNRTDTGTPYEFVSLTQVLEEFFSHATEALQKLGLSGEITGTSETPMSGTPRSEDDSN